jgi:hypothetical protein
MTHLHHCEQKSMTEPYYENLLKEVTKTKTMGAPRKPLPRRVKVPHRAQNGDTASLAGSERELRKTAGGGAVILDVETLKSKIPMKWAAGSGVATTSYMVSAAATLSRLANESSG